MCFGVRAALETAGAIAEPTHVTIYGELVHNQVVLDRLGQKGFCGQRENDRLETPATEQVLVTAHGISDWRRAQLLAAGKRLVDTTCPLVTRVHRAAQQLARQGFHVLVIGRRGHVEVQGIVEDLAAFDIVERPDNVREFGSRKLGIVVQTTTPVTTARELYDLIALYNPLAEIRYVDTICDPTKQRIAAVEALVDRIDVLVVVGGRNSNNTRQLAEIGLGRGVPTFCVQRAEEVQRCWFEGDERVGLTAGTSTLDETVQEVKAAILSCASATVRSEVSGDLP
jgi:4-hydroxy-3-methylbut-2-enyl diphosphate reductase